MYKILSVLILGMVLTGCSQSEQEDPKFVESASTSSLVEFGTLKPTDSQKLMSATIYNTTGAVLEGPATISNSDFAFVSGYNCPNGAKNKASCAAIKLTFNPQGKVAGEYTATLDLGSISVPLHATIEAIQEPTPEDIASGISSSMGDQVDFGSMLSTGNSVIKTITLTNGNSVAINTAIDTSSLSPFILSYDACSNKSIAKGKNCQIKVSLSPAQLSGSQSGSLSYAGKEISFSAEVITPASVAQSGEPAVIGGVSYSPNLQFLINNSVVSTYEVPQGTVSLNIVVKNTGNLASAVSTASLSGSELSIVSNGCSNRSLSPNQSCTVKVVVVGSSQHSSSSSLSYSGVSLDLTVPGSGGGGNVKIYDGETEITSVNLGEVMEGERGVKVLTLKNHGLTQSVISFGIEGTGYGLTNTCDWGTNSYVLDGGAECTATVYFDNELESDQEPTLAPGFLYFNGLTISLSATKNTDIEWLVIEEGSYMDIPSRPWNTVQTGGNKSVSPSYVNHNFVGRDVLTHNIEANENVVIDALYVNYDKSNYQILNSSGEPILQHENDNSSFIEFEEKLHLAAGDHIKVVLTFPYAQNNIRIYEDITTANNGLSFSPVLKNGVALGGKYTVSSILTIQDYETIVQLSFSQWGFNEPSTSLIEGRTIKLKALRLKQVGFMVDESSSLINIAPYTGFPSLMVNYQKMFPMEFGNLGQKFPVMDNDEETEFPSGDHTWLIPSGIDSATFQWRFFSTQRVPRTPILKIPLLKLP